MLGIALIGTGQIALQNHLPGFAWCPDTRVVALCDTNAEALAKAARQTGISCTFAAWQDVLNQDDVHAVVIATPNFTHAPMAIAAARAGKHVLCEKPLAMTAPQARTMLDACRSAGVRHMTAFTYRFVPAMRWMHHLVSRGDIGQPLHFRAQRFQDWGERFLAWRQVKAMAATGEMGDMLSHRIDFAHYLVGRMKRLSARLRQFLPTRGGQPSDVDDWVTITADFTGGQTGVLESTKLAAGYGSGIHSHDWCEVNGLEGTLVYRVTRPNTLLMGKKGQDGLQEVPVPAEFLKPAGSPRDLASIDPALGFRYDQDFEFVSAIRESRDCSPGFEDGLAMHSVMDAAVESDASGRWIDVAYL